MLVDRRSLIAGGLASLVAAPSLAQRRSAGSSWYDRAIIIDALGGTADPYGPNEWLRWSDRAWAETVGTGVTMVRDTIFPVGNVADPWGDYQKEIAFRKSILGANPDRLILIRSAADILKAKREKKFGVLVGTQDSAMVGPELDRRGQHSDHGRNGVVWTSVRPEGSGRLLPDAHR